MKQQMHTPEGVRDIYGKEYKKKLMIEEKLQKVLHLYGYQDIQTPMFEYFEVFGKEVGTIPSKDLYKFFDKEGNTLVLRPDITPSIARVATTVYESEDMPIRLCYKGNTFVNHSNYLGRLRENTQLGAELIGVDSMEADAEMIAMAVESLKEVGLKDFQIHIGNVDFFEGLIKEAKLTEEDELHLREFIGNRNSFGVDELLENKDAKVTVKTAFQILPELTGGIEILKEAKENIFAFHKRQVNNSFVINEKEGTVIGQKVIPLSKVGLYVPGGTAAYPSSVLMNCIPAVIAGCDEIVMVTPPSKDGTVNPVILAAAKIAGVGRIFKIGGAQAVAALAYGTESVPRVDKIVGPGNRFVAQAKRMVFGQVDIDMIAGPSEILVIADSTCNPRFVAADMLSQAEHDRLASAILLTDSEDLAAAVSKELEIQIPMLSRNEIARASVDGYGAILIVDSIDEAIEISNEIAPEHLELCVDNPFDLLSKVRNAGSVFLGKNCPEALGDYFAGPNHTLPTSGTAKFSSPLSVEDFVKRTQFTYYTREALGEVYSKIAYFAEKEGLTAHAKSATIRFE